MDYVHTNSPWISKNFGCKKSLFMFMFAVIMILIAVAISAQAFYVAGKTLHSQLLQKVMRGKMTFFDSKPLGMILNRFSKDIDSIGKLIQHDL